MSETNKYEGHTPGPYLREGTSVYALEDVPDVYRRGVPAQQNRIYFGVQGSAPQEEKEAVAALLQDAPELLRQRDALLAALERGNWFMEQFKRMDDHHADQQGRHRDALLNDAILQNKALIAATKGGA